MTHLFHCARCGRDNPADAQFCIECSATLMPAVTGATTKLAGLPCRACRTLNPEDACFCVVCGRSFGAATAPPQHPAARRVPPVPPVARHSFPRVAPHAPPWHAARRPNTGVLFLFGLAFLFITGMFWPGILLLIGAVRYVEESGTGQARRGLKTLVWFAGLTILFATNTFWPGILVLLVLSWLVE